MLEVMGKVDNIYIVCKFLYILEEVTGIWGT